MRKAKPEKKENIVQNIQITQIRRTTQDIESWRNAIKAAENIQTPKRVLLYDLYDEILLDGHLSAVVEKRKLSVTNTPLYFIENGKINDEITNMITTENFMNLLGYIIESKIWGHSLIEILIQDNILIPVLIPRKHVVPEKGLVLKNQSDITGLNYRDYPFVNYLLEVGEKQSLGLLMKAAQYVIYKRCGYGDWAQYCELFGMPFRIAKYDSYDEKTRTELEGALKAAGSAAYIVIPKEANLEFIQNNTQGSSELYETLINGCNRELSKLILGQTMTTETGGSFAQAKVHQQVEVEIHNADKLFVRNILNDKLIPLLKVHGFNTGNGRFVFQEKENIEKSIRLEMDLKLAEKIKIDDNYFYETYNIPNPINKNGYN